ncbi:hypothetical protein ACWGKK_43000 [Streptomyces chartreusis]|uniref:hypothetical protein n=1 Tax=Streptomyces chartreusis TaxID=1969 RepID=UPI00378B685B
MDPVTLTAGLGAAASLSRLAYVWLSARLHRRRIELEIRMERERYASLMASIRALPPGSEITETTPDGRRVTIKLPPTEAA